MSKITVSDSALILKIHRTAQALMRHHYAQLQSLVQDLGPLLHERPSRVGDCYAMLEGCLRGNVSTHQAMGVALEAYEAHALMQQGYETAGLPLSLIAYQTLIQDQLQAYQLLKLQHLCIDYALSMMCLNYGFEEGSAGAFCIRQLKEAFKAPKAFTCNIVFVFKAMNAVLGEILNTDQDRCVSGMELVASVAMHCQGLSLETVPFIPTPYGGTALRLARLKEAQAAHRYRAAMDDKDRNLGDAPMMPEET